MKIYVIYRKGTNTKTLKLLESAANDLGVQIEPIISNNFDFSACEKVSGQDAVYCLSDDAQSQLVEKCIVGMQTKTLYADYKTMLAKVDDADDITSYLVHKAKNLPVIPSIPAITKDKDLLSKYAQKLGGFPIVIKALGGSKGHGTMRIDSMASLKSVDDYLVGTKDRFIIKKYIEEARSIRAVVLGERVVAAIEHEALPDDFRSNSGKGDHHTQAYKCTQEEEEIAIEAVRSLGFEFGGVDLSVTDEGTIYITEVNMPCAYGITQRATGIDIAREIIQYLKNKA